MTESSFGEVRLEGRHVRLEPLALEHTGGLLAAADSSGIWDWLSFEIRDRREAERFVRTALRSRDERGDHPFAVILRDSERVVGSTRYLDVHPEHRTLEIGYTWYSPSVWATTVNPECKFLLMRHAFEVWGANRVAFKTDLRNRRSQAAIRKLGARFEGTLRNDRVRRDGSLRDTLVFSVTRAEWPEVAAGLLRRLS